MPIFVLFWFFFSLCLYTIWLNCDFTNSLRNICKLYLWLISLQMWYMMEITRGMAFSPPRVLIFWEWTKDTKHCCFYVDTVRSLKSWSTHTLQNWSPGSEDEGIKPQADPSKSHASWSYREPLQGDPTLQKPKALEHASPFLPRCIHPKLQPYPQAKLWLILSQGGAGSPAIIHSQ